MEEDGDEVKSFEVRCLFPFNILKREDFKYIFTFYCFIIIIEMIALKDYIHTFRHLQKTSFCLTLADDQQWLSSAPDLTLL